MSKLNQAWPVSTTIAEFLRLTWCQALFARWQQARVTLRTEPRPGANRASSPVDEPTKLLICRGCELDSLFSQSTHNTDFIVESKVIYYLKQCGLRV